MPRNTDTGVRYVCGDCATTDGREVVNAFPSKTGGACKLCDTYIDRGEFTYVLDSGIRKGRKPTTETTRPTRQRANLDALNALHRKIVGEGGLEARLS